MHELVINLYIYVEYSQLGILIEGFSQKVRFGVSTSTVVHPRDGVRVAALSTDNVMLTFRFNHLDKLTQNIIGLKYLGTLWSSEALGPGQICTCYFLVSK